MVKIIRNENNECRTLDMKNELSRVYSHIEEMKGSGIIEVSIDNSEFPLEAIVSLKEKINLVTQKLKEIEEILKR